MTQQELFAPNPTPYQKSERLRDKGIKKGLTHAEQERLGWKLLALHSLGHFLGSRGNLPFLAEAFRIFAHNDHVPDPPDARAWGAVMSAAKREGLIVSVGFDRALTSNLSPKVLWRKA